MSTHLKTGSNGERLAADFLRSKGYTILTTNWKAPNRCELDIIAREGDVVIFVEVKTRTSVSHGFPEEAVNHAKQERIAHAAEEFLIQNRMDSEIRFDVVSIVQIPGQPNEFYHIRDAFIPGID